MPKKHVPHENMKYFNEEHSPEELQKVAKPFADLAEFIDKTGDKPEGGQKLFAGIVLFMQENLPENRQRNRAIFKVLQAKIRYVVGDKEAALDYLLEAKDCAVRAKLPELAKDSKK